MTTTAQPNAAVVTGTDLVAYFTSDPQRSIAFYRDVLGMQPTDVDDEGRGAEFELSDGSTFGIWKPDDGEKQSGAAIMFAVENISDAVALLRGRGADLSDPHETPVCFMSFGADPDGNAFIVHQRKRGAP